MKKYLILLVSLLFLMGQCHKPLNPEPDLPLATQEGKGTIGCYFNGEPWLPKPYLCIMCEFFFGVIYKYQELNIHSINYKYTNAVNIDQRIDLKIALPKLGENKILTDIVLVDSKDRMNIKYYDLDTTKPRTIFLTKLDSINKIIAGTFELTAIDKKNNHTIVITKGRFDAGKYYCEFR